MITYLYFSVEGDITEIKIKDKLFLKENYSNYSFIENVTHNKYNFIVLYNKNENDKKNITSLPFLKKEIKGNFLLFLINNNEIKSLTENKLLKMFNNIQLEIEDYSSDDFNLSD